MIPVRLLPLLKIDSPRLSFTGVVDVAVTGGPFTIDAQDSYNAGSVADDYYNAGSVAADQD